MMMEELRVDMRERTPEEQAIYDRQAQLMFKLNHTMPRTEEYMGVLKELFEDRIGETIIRKEEQYQMARRYHEIKGLAEFTAKTIVSDEEQWQNTSPLPRWRRGKSRIIT